MKKDIIRSVRNQQGKTLVELILFLGVYMMALVLSISQVHDFGERVVAEQAGQQISQAGDALDVYIGKHYRQLMNLQSSPAPRFTGDIDNSAGGRNCDGSGCDVSYTAMVEDNILPTTFTNKNIFGAGYKFRVARRILANTGCGDLGDQPCYKLTGIAITDTPFYFNSAEGYVGRIRYDLLGTAVESAGKHQGFTPPGSPNVIMGYEGSWSEGSADFPAINQSGLLAARRGYETSTDSEYVRRDGTLPMTGDLNMMHVDGGGHFYRHSILNINTVKANRFISGDKTLPTVIFGTRDGNRDTYIQQGGELRVADYDGNPGIIRAEDMFIANRGSGKIALSELLPTSALRGSYWVKDGQSVPKPYCQNGPNGEGTESTAKIVLYPGIQQILTMSFNRRMRLAEYNCPSDSVWTSWANDAGDHWTINLGSYATNNYSSGNSDADGNTDITPNTTPFNNNGGDASELNYVLAQTFCDYSGSQKSAVRGVSTAMWTQYENAHYQCALDGFVIPDSTKVISGTTGNAFGLGNNPPKDFCANALFASAAYGNNTNYPNPLSCSKQVSGDWVCKGRLPKIYKPVGCKITAGGGITLFGNP